VEEILSASSHILVNLVGNCINLALLKHVPYALSQLILSLKKRQFCLDMKARNITQATVTFKMQNNK
jgi:hypothetical protein